MTPLIKEMVSLSVEAATGFIWFDAGRVIEVYSGDESAIRNDPVPFESCAIVGRDADNRKFLLMVVAKDSPKHGQVIIVNGFVMWVSGYRKIDGFTLVRKDGDLSIGPDEAGNETPDPSSYLPIVAILDYWLTKSNPVGYQAAVKTNSLTNARRAAKGKQPLIYDWHTVAIEPPKQKSPHQGGTHASPRLHERRGHWRITRSGKRVWVRDCMVGNAALGTVFKDYKLSEIKIENHNQ